MQESLTPQAVDWYRSTAHQELRHTSSIYVCVGSRQSMKPRPPSSQKTCPSWNWSLAPKDWGHCSSELGRHLFELIPFFPRIVSKPKDEDLAKMNVTGIFLFCGFAKDMSASGNFTNSKHLSIIDLGDMLVTRHLTSFEAESKSPEIAPSALSWSGDNLFQIIL